MTIGQVIDVESRDRRGDWFWRLSAELQDEVLSKVYQAMAWRGWDADRRGEHGKFGRCYARDAISDIARLLWEKAGIAVGEYT